MVPLRQTTQTELLARQLSEADSEVLGSGKMTFAAAVFSLTNTIIGSGSLTMPFVFAQVGWLSANVFALAMVSVTTFSACMLAITSDRIGGDRARSWEALGFLACGPLGSLYAEATFICGGFGTVTGYLVFVGQLVAQIAGLGDRSLIPIVAISACVLVPLTWPRRINALRYASFLALAAIFYIVAMYAAFFGSIGRYDDDSTGKYKYVEPEAVHFTSQSINSFNLLIGAFCVHNTVLPIYGEMRNRSPRKLGKAISCAMVVAFIIYEIIGMCGYILLGGNVPSDSLTRFDGDFSHAHPWTDVPRDVAKALMASVIALSLPMAMWPCRSAVCSVLLTMSAGCTRPEPGTVPGSLLFHGVTLVILAIVTVLAIKCPDITIPLGLVNSLAGGSMVFIMPGLFYLASLPTWEERRSIAHWPAYAMIAAGVVVCTVGFTLELKSILLKWG